MFCPKCGAEAAAAAQFCHKCGTALPIGTSETPVATPPSSDSPPSGLRSQIARYMEWCADNPYKAGGVLCLQGIMMVMPSFMFGIKGGWFVGIWSAAIAIAMLLMAFCAMMSHKL